MIAPLDTSRIPLFSLVLSIVDRGAIRRDQFGVMPPQIIMLFSQETANCKLWVMLITTRLSDADRERTGQVGITIWA
jgi:hypothetical protein